MSAGASVAEPIRVTNTSRGTLLADQARLATTFWRRLVGLLDRSRLEQGEALWLEPCNSVHMWFMRFPIDVVFINRQGYVVSVVPHLPQWSFTWPQRGADTALELPVGTIAASRTEPGDRIVKEAACA